MPDSADRKSNHFDMDACLHLSLYSRGLAQDVDCAFGGPCRPGARLNESHGCECAGSLLAPERFRTEAMAAYVRLGSSDRAGRICHHCGRHRRGPVRPGGALVSYRIRYRPTKEQQWCISPVIGRSGTPPWQRLGAAARFASGSGHSPPHRQRGFGAGSPSHRTWNSTR